MNRILTLVFGLFCYALFGVTSAFAFCFLANIGLPNTLDSSGTGNVAFAVVVDLALLTLFALQHSVMARPWFKRWWTQFVPQSSERSVYLLASCAALGLLIAAWQPLGFTLWEVKSPLIRTALFTSYIIGWLTVVGSSLLISHFELFGLRQVWLHYRNLPNNPLPFHTPSAYRFVRHPLYVGWLIVFWSAPAMTASHLLFSAGTTLYILLAIRWEEHDLLTHFGQQYADYQQQVPMLFPWRWTAPPPARPTAPLPNRALSRTIKGNTDILKTSP